MVNYKHVTTRDLFLRNLRCKTFLPCLSVNLAINPCFLFRLTTLGWYVLLMFQTASPRSVSQPNEGTIEKDEVVLGQTVPRKRLLQQPDSTNVDNPLHFWCFETKVDGDDNDTDPPPNIFKPFEVVLAPLLIKTFFSVSIIPRWAKRSLPVVRTTPLWNNRII